MTHWRRNDFEFHVMCVKESLDVQVPGRVRWLAPFFVWLASREKCWSTILTRPHFDWKTYESVSPSFHKIQSSSRAHWEGSFTHSSISKNSTHWNQNSILLQELGSIRRVSGRWDLECIGKSGVERSGLWSIGLTLCSNGAWNQLFCWSTPIAVLSSSHSTEEPHSHSGRSHCECRMLIVDHHIIAFNAQMSFRFFRILKLTCWYNKRSERNSPNAQC